MSRYSFASLANDSGNSLTGANPVAADELDLCKHCNVAVFDSEACCYFCGMPTTNDVPAITAPLLIAASAPAEISLDEMRGNDEVVCAVMQASQQIDQQQVAWLAGI